jgi:hypothetical protein
MKTYGGVKTAPQLLTSAMDGSEWSASCPGRFTSRERAYGTDWAGDWVGLRVGLDAVEKRKNCCPCRKSNPDRPSRSPSLH